MSDLDRAEKWFQSRGWKPFEFQREVWRSYLAGESGLIHAATGTGKTFAAWWGPLLEYLNDETSARRNQGRDVPLRVLWITPLRALADTTEVAAFGEGNQLLRLTLDGFSARQRGVDMAVQEEARHLAPHRNRRQAVDDLDQALLAEVLEAHQLVRGELQ